MSSDLSPRIAQSARAHGFELDGAQRRVLVSFERLDRELQAAQRNGSSLLGWLRREPAPRGIYLWGAVGTGKSFLMDAFFHAVAVDAKRRVHFHRFMQQIHVALRTVQGQEEPLRIVAREVARDAKLLCLDEMHVVDIGDAMLMRGLLEGLFEQGVALVTTSNQHPDDLYLHGLQRGQFLPAIALMKERLEVVELTGEEDYRLRVLEHAGVYHFPVDAKSEAMLKDAFARIADEPGEENDTLEIEGREMPVRRVAPGIAWFDFQALCEGPRASADYIELARRYHTILVSGVPRFRANMAETIRRFTWLVDEFYDRRVKLILSAEVAVQELYAGIAARPEIERTQSRLIEMQTKRYLSQGHLG
ncbi:MAG TPA: cell division protein ZapE [Burkholderiales bacterium]|nr:cell division protein ZapE [Burkholderiales bacterium]